MTSLRQKAERQMAADVGTQDQDSLTQNDDVALCNINNVNAHAPIYYTASLQMFHKLFQTMSNISGIGQIESVDCSFKYRKITNATTNDRLHFANWSNETRL
jgi:hypothetical protein